MKQVLITIWLAAFGLCAVTCQANKSRPMKCDTSDDNWKRFTFEQFQVNTTKVNGTLVRKCRDKSKAVDTGAFANADQENGKLDGCLQLMGLSSVANNYGLRRQLAKFVDFVRLQ